MRRFTILNRFLRCCPVIILSDNYPDDGIFKSFGHLILYNRK
jgi:hypothetical protein